MGMRLRQALAGACLAPALCLALSGEGRGDDRPKAQEPGFFGRMFRSGGNAGRNQTPTPPPLPAPGRTGAEFPAPTNPRALPYSTSLPSAMNSSTPVSPYVPQYGPASTQPGANAANRLPVGGFSSASDSNSGAGPRLTPQPRVNRAVTEAEPILTRIALGRTDNNQQFGMFLHVFADGTVIDSEGVHKLSRDVLSPLMEAIDQVNASKVRGHCGGPPTDFMEQIHVVVYERGMGRMRANSFSYSGNPQGCDPSIAHLQAAVDALQAKLSGTPASPAPANASPLTHSYQPGGIQATSPLPLH